MGKTNNDNYSIEQKEREQININKEQTFENKTASENDNIRPKDQEREYARKLSEHMSRIPEPIRKGKKLKWPTLKDMQDALNMLGFSIYTSLKKDDITSGTLEKCKNRLFKELSTYTEFVEHIKKWTDLSINLRKSLIAYGDDATHTALEILSKFSIDKKKKFRIDGVRTKGFWSEYLQKCVQMMFQIYDANKKTGNGFFAGMIKS